MTKQLIKDNIEKLKSPFSKRLTKVTSGGSTGESTVIYKTNYFLEMSHAAAMRNFATANWLPHNKSVWLWGAPYEHQKVKESIISRIGMYINGRLLFNTYSYSPKDFPKWQRMIEKFKPEVMYGYASVILEFAKWCFLNNVYFPSIRRVISTSETLRNRDAIERAFRCKVYDQYGSREVPGIAIECKNGNMHISDDTIIVEQTNERHLLITALESFGFPIIRYKIGDTGKKLNKLCTCGLNFSLMDLNITRITDNFIRPNGAKVAGTALATYISTLNINIKEYQLIQKSLNHFELKFVGNIAKSDRDKFIGVLKSYFGEIEIDFVKVSSAPLEASGKRLLFKCLIGKDEKN